MVSALTCKNQAYTYCDFWACDPVVSAAATCTTASGGGTATRCSKVYSFGKLGAYNGKCWSKVKLFQTRRPLTALSSTKCRPDVWPGQTPPPNAPSLLALTPPALSTAQLKTATTSTVASHHPNCMKGLMKYLKWFVLGNVASSPAPASYSISLLTSPPVINICRVLFFWHVASITCIQCTSCVITCSSQLFN